MNTINKGTSLDHRRPDDNLTDLLNGLFNNTDESVSERLDGDIVNDHTVVTTVESEDGGTHHSLTLTGDYIETFLDGLPIG